VTIVMTPDPDLRYGKPTRAQAEAFVTLAGHAFAFDPAQWLGSLGDDGWDNIRTLTHGDDVAAGLVFHSAGQWFGGQRVPSCAISAVLAAPESRRRKLGHRLMLHGLRETRAAGVPLSVLYASTPAFYRGLGFEPAGEQLFRRVASHHLPTDTEGARYRPLTADAEPALHELYTRFARAHTGLLDRTAHFWRAHVRPYDGSKRYLYGVELDGVLEGYVSLQHARPQSTLVVQEAIATDARAARAVLALLSHHKSVAEWVVFPDGPQGPLNKVIPGNQARPEPSPQEWLLRVVDVRGALEQRGYPPLDAELELDVVDAALPENEGRYVLKLSEGRPPQVSSGGAGRLRLDVRALSAIYSGFSHPSEMQAAGLLSGEARDVALLGAVFAGPRAFLLDAF
jgi:predicted acetyltransferase